MPFTLAHPAAILPLLKASTSRGVKSALVVGSMVPDLVYFLPFELTRHQSHSPIGLFAICLPLGLISYIVYHTLIIFVMDWVKPLTLTGSLPSNWATGKLPKASWHIVTIASLLGSLTHILWDDFTHASGNVVQALPFLQAVLFTWDIYELKVYSALQHISSIIGLGVIATWSIHRIGSDALLQMLKSLKEPSVFLKILAIIGPALITASIAGLAAFPTQLTSINETAGFVGTMIFKGGTALLFTLIVLGVALRMRRRTLVRRTREGRS